MLADALAQFLGYKQWQDWVLVQGNTDEDLSAWQKGCANRPNALVTVSSEKRLWPHDPYVSAR